MIEKLIRRLRFGPSDRKTPPSAPKRVPPPESYAERQAIALSIEGMTSAFAMQIMDSLLAHQTKLGISGHLVEFGVFKGRSASIMSAHAKPEERLILSDISQLLTEDVLPKIYTHPEFILGRSEDFRNNLDVSTIRHSVRFAHVDSSHSYRTTLAEMALIDELLSPEGIACLDDFANLNYSQLLPAIFKYLYSTDTDLTFFLVTNEKGYLCRRPYFEQYGGFVLNDLVGQVRERGNPSVTLSRTDVDPEYRAFYLRERHPDETGERYAEELYGEFYQSP